MKPDLNSAISAFGLSAKRKLANPSARGEPVGKVVRLAGDIESSGSQLVAPPELLPLFERFLRWDPIPPRSAKELARVSARLCRLLRDEVTEQLALGSEALTALAVDWRKLLFPDATDERFADGYAQAVTFGMLIARAKDIRLATGFARVAEELGQTSSLIGAALRLLTDSAENQATLKTSLGTLTRVRGPRGGTAPRHRQQAAGLVHAPQAGGDAVGDHRGRGVPPAGGLGRVRAPARSCRGEHEDCDPASGAHHGTPPIWRMRAIARCSASRPPLASRRLGPPTVSAHARRRLAEAFQRVEDPCCAQRAGRPKSRSPARPRAGHGPAPEVRIPRHVRLIRSMASRPSGSAVADRELRTGLPAPPSRRGLATTLLAGIVLIAAVMLETGSAQGFVLGTKTDYATGDYPRSLALGDLNGDGRLDLAVVDFADTLVSVLLGDGLGGFSARTDYGVGYQPLSVVIEDVSGDGRPDVLVANFASRTVALLPGDGLGGLGARTDYYTARGPFCVAVGDVNEDGRPDLVTADYLADSVSVLLGDGAGGFGARKDFATGSGPRSATIGDLNGDGRLDLVVTNYNTSTIGVLLGDGAGGFGTHVDFATGTSPFYAAIGDVSGDGKPDVAVANASQSTISVLLGDGAGGFPTRMDRFSGSGPVSIAIGDVGGDARPDLVVANNGGENGTVSVFPGNGAGGFGTKLDFATGASSRWAAIGDMNGDGRPDLVVSNALSDNVSVLLGNSGGMFGGKTDFTTGGTPASISIGDVSGDGRPDLVTANSVLNTVSVQLGDGIGGFGVKTDFATGSDPVSVAIEDVSGDGLPDLAVANESGGTVSVLLGDGAGGFGVNTDFISGVGSRSVAIEDLSGDSLPDLVVANNATNTVSVLLGYGVGGFGTATSFATGAAPVLVAIADVSNDGKPDLAVANAGDGTVSILLGDGAGGFGVKTDFVTGSGSRSVAIGDVNGDGRPDLAVANAGTASVSVLPGDGAGGFGTRTGFATGDSPVAVAIGDVNGDGRPDLVVADSASSTVSVLLGNGVGGFGPRTLHATGVGPVSVAIGDVSGDGRLDLAVANRNAGSVSVLLGLVPTRTVLAAGPKSAVLGSPLTLTATVSVPAPGHGTPADSVRFFDGPMLIGTAPVIGGGAGVVLPAAHLGDRSLTAVYKGDGKLFGSIAAMQVLRVVARAEPVITRIADVENDQGGHVSVRFAASSFDYVGSGTPITGYDVYRALPAAASMRAPAQSRIEEPRSSVSDAGRPRTAFDGWTAVAAVTATLAHEYQIVVATLADSNGTGPNRATLMVRALIGTPGVFYDSAPDSGCSVDNLPPAQPVSFNGSDEGGTIHLNWRANAEPDLCCYRVHRGVTPYFEPAPGNLIATLSDTGYVDPDPGPPGSCYKLAAVDVNGNPSAYALLIPGGTVDVAGITTWSFTLGRVEPNPSRGEGLLVRFTLPTAAPARLELLDVSGRRVLERAVGAMGPGRHALELAARHLAAGIYFLRLSQGGSVLTTRVAVLK